jgi:hypothetical protein
MERRCSGPFQVHSSLFRSPLHVQALPEQMKDVLTACKSSLTIVADTHASCSAMQVGLNAASRLVTPTRAAPDLGRTRHRWFPGVLCFNLSPRISAGNRCKRALPGGGRAMPLVSRTNGATNGIPGGALRLDSGQGERSFEGPPKAQSHNWNQPPTGVRNLTVPPASCRRNPRHLTPFPALQGRLYGPP